MIGWSHRSLAGHHKLLVFLGNVGTCPWKFCLDGPGKAGTRPMWLLGAGLFLGLLTSSWVAGIIPELAVVNGLPLGMWGPWPQLPILPRPSSAAPGATGYERCRTRNRGTP